ncbi:Hypothetical protein, putative [Bodo saltans]|uniref:Uncharacterized protein n=1 Tax=Bodo saltans TaxID=75058 RepID=A0A0S4IT94_BODSA|nr:Hypothetical protein, putative [Bodo saltans]|eukprot:CUG06472.1 Hypothetical protein, putative [Bodo saltans]
MPCEDKLQCERKRKMSFPCRRRVFYDDDVWDFCSPAARLNKSVYVVNPPLHVANRSVRDEDVWRTLSLPLREAWRAVRFPTTSHVAKRRSSEEEEGRRVSCSTAQRRAIVGFAAKFMRPFQVIALVLSAYRAMGADPCTNMHLFVTDPDHPMLLHLQALTTYSLDADVAASMSPSELLTAKRSGKLRDSFLVLEAFKVYEGRVHSMSGNNHRVEVVRINVIRWWLQHGDGQRYHQFVFTDTRDAVFTGDIFRDVASTLRDARAVTETDEYIYAATEEFPFFRQPRLGLQWNVEVHSTTFGYEMMMLMQKFHLDDYPFMRLINSGVYGGTYNALLDLFEIWGASAAAVYTETFGVDQPLLGGLLYFGLRMAGYSHRAVLLSGSDGPLRHLYTDGGTEQKYPFMRLELHNGTRMFSDEFMRRVAAPSAHDEHPILHPSLTGTFEQAPGPHHLNCKGQRYSIVHQSDRYPLVWRSLTEPISGPTIAWAKANGVEWTWGPRKIKRKGKSSG